MYCLTNICYVCLEEKGKSLVNITSSLSVNKDMMHIISDLPFNLGWMKTKPIVLICEECCRRLRETCHLLAMCLRSSAVMQGYIDRLNTGSISTTDNEAELCVNLVNTQGDIDMIKCEIKSENEEIYTFESGPIFEETEVVFVNVNDAFIKEENTWQMEAEVDEEELRMENNSTENRDNETDPEIAENNSDTHDTDSSAITTNKKKPNTPAIELVKCPTCNKSFTGKKQLQSHKRVHKDSRRYKCGTCAKYCRDNFDLRRHERTHTGEKPYICDVCKKRYKHEISLVSHKMRHTDEKPYRCFRCNKRFKNKNSPLQHIKKCTVCGDKFCSKVQLKSHMRVHSGQ